MGSCMSRRSICKDEYFDDCRSDIIMARNAPPLSPVRRNRLQFLNDSNGDVTIDNLPWEGDDSLL